MRTDERILKAAVETFLRFGYHGTRMQAIADKAMANKAELFYYFRSKEKLYKEVLRLLINEGNESAHPINEIEYFHLKKKWFFFTELYNNRTFFLDILQQVAVANNKNTIAELFRNYEDLIKLVHTEH